MKKYRILDCFCWIWWFSKWFMDEWFEIEYWIDIWDTALKTYKSFHPWIKTLCKDITKVKDSYFKSLEKDIDIIIWWPPCQGFSMSWQRKENDIRNILFKEMVRATKLIQPKVVIVENVVWLLSMKDENWKLYKDIIIEDFNNIWYQVRYKILTASDYWVPQERKRVIFVISKNIEEYEYPKHSINKVTVWDALSNIPDSWKEKYLKEKNDFQKLMSKNNISKKIYNHPNVSHKELISTRMSHVPQWGNWKDIPMELWQWWWTHSNNYKRLDENKPSITIKHATKSMIIHPWYNRCLTPREVARLQSFPDDLILYWAKFEQHQQLANAVPPILSLYIAKSIKIFLNKIDKNDEKI
jgi:DNA (cytosine-5)-methyltransferase 1